MHELPAARPRTPVLRAPRLRIAGLRVPIFRIPGLRAFLLLFAWVGLASCGGGGGGSSGGGGGGGGGAPTALAYPDPSPVWRTDAPVPAQVPAVQGGTPDLFTVAPALPPGLSLDPATGVVSGTPLAPSPPTPHLVTASNAAGAASGPLTVQVLWAEHKSLAPRTALGLDDLRHFLLRTHWAATSPWLEQVQALGLQAYVEQMLGFPPIGSTPWEQEAGRLLAHPEDPPGQEGLFPTAAQLARWHVHLLVLDPSPFQEVLAFFWHDHFATSSEVLTLGRTYYMRRHVDLLREMGTGNLRDLLTAVARDWAMLWWLDGVISTRAAPNENFAREFFELFTLGVDAGYTQEDILEAARAFTGYQDQVLDPATGLRHVVFVPGRHDAGDKVIFGVTIPGQSLTDDYRAVVDVTVDNRDVAGWIARKLCAHFCYEDPAPELVAQLAQVMREEGYELRPVLSTLLRSEAFFSARAREGFVKGPVEAAVGFLRATGLLPIDARTGALDHLAVVGALAQLGQLPTRPPTVDGWPEGTMWLSAQGMVDRANFLRLCIVDRADQALAGIDVADLLPSPAPLAAEVVDALAQRLRVTLTSAERQVLVTYLDTDRRPDGTVFADPFDPGNRAHLESRVRGLLYVLGQHPTYAIR